MSSADRNFQAGPGMWVRVRYDVFDEEGERVEHSAQEISYVHGYGALLPRLEAVLEGKRAGDTCELTLLPREAFGPRKKEAILELSREEFPEDVAAGDRFDAETEQGGVVVLRVLEVHPDSLVVDTNHPLAGQRVRFALSVLEVRPATAEELSAAEARISTEFAEPATAATAAPGAAAGGPLISVERLLRGASQRYEMGRSEPGNAGIDPADDES